MKDNQYVLNKIFESISNYVAPMTTDTVEPESFYTQFKMGIGLNTLNTKDASLMADASPKVQRDYIQGFNVSDQYSKILSSKLPEDSPSPIEEEKYEQALQLINDDDPKYKKYVNTKKEYDTAILNYYWKKNDSNSSEIDIAKAKMEMDAAYKSLVAAGKSEYENAFNIVATHNKYTPSAVFDKANSVFGSAQDMADTFGYFETNFIPSSWLDNSGDDLAWAKITIKTDSVDVKLTSETAKTTFSSYSDLSGGWWFWKYADRVSKTQQEAVDSANSDVKSSNLSLSMEIAQVQINRAWFNSSLLTYSEAYIPNEDAGVICSGTLNGNGGMQLIPCSFILIRNLSAYGGFSEETNNLINTIKDSNENELHFGPFCVTESKSLNFHSDITEEEHKQYGECSRIDFGSLPQIIGVLSSVSKPKFPAKSGK